MSDQIDMKALAVQLKETADTMLKVAAVLEGNIPNPVEKPASEEKPKITLVQVREVLANKSRAGYTEEVRNLLMKYGAEKLSKVDPKQYEALMKDAEVIGSGT